MTEITTAITSVFGIVGTTLTEITSDPILTLFFVVPLIGMGCGILRRLKRI